MKDLAGLRILAFCDYFSPQSSGGAERVAYEVYRRLVSLGAEVLLLTTVSSGAQNSYETDGIHIRVVPALDLSRVTRAQVSFAPRVVTEATRLSRRFQPNVLHANSLHFQTSIGCAILRSRSGCPMVTTVHLARPENLSPVLRTLTSVYELTVGRFVLRGNEEVIAVSHAVATHVHELGVPRSRIAVVLNGVDHERFQPRNGVEASPSRPLVLFVGRLIPNKGPWALLEAVARLRRAGVQADVVFLGDGPVRGELEGRSKDLGMADRVRFQGHSSDVAGWLQRADVLVRPSFTEGLPLTVLEAMASGVCVVASDIPGNADLIRHGENGLLFPVGDVPALADTLRRVLADPGERRSLAAAGWKASLSYSWDACAEAVGEILSRASVRGRTAP